MSRIPDDLDPRTLRWVADRHHHYALTQDAWFNALDVVTDASRSLWKTRTHYARCEAKRLRALATRIERRRGGA